MSQGMKLIGPMGVGVGMGLILGNLDLPWPWGPQCTVPRIPPGALSGEDCFSIADSFQKSFINRTKTIEEIKNQYLLFVKENPLYVEKFPEMHQSSQDLFSKARSGGESCGSLMGKSLELETRCRKIRNDEMSQDFCDKAKLTVPAALAFALIGSFAILALGGRDR